MPQAEIIVNARPAWEIIVAARFGGCLPRFGRGRKRARGATSPRGGGEFTACKPVDGVGRLLCAAMSTAWQDAADGARPDRGICSIGHVMLCTSRCTLVITR